MACSSSCRTQDHKSYGECLRSKNLKTAYMQEWKGADATRQKKADRELEAYAKARSEGIQPQSTKMHHVEAAVKASDQAGVAFRAEL
jgi:hypothetical protein